MGSAFGFFGVSASVFFGSAASRRRRLALLGRLARTAVVGRVEPRALEVDRDRVQHLLDRTLAADLADLRGRVVHPVEELENVPVRTAILVDGHVRTLAMNKDRKLLALGSGLCAAAVGALLLTRLRSYPPHEDEVLALFVARDSLGGVLDTVLTERGGAPLHYLLAWAVVHLGGGLDALRLVSVACAVASVPLMAALAARLIDSGSGARCHGPRLGELGLPLPRRLRSHVRALPAGRHCVVPGPPRSAVGLVDGRDVRRARRASVRRAAVGGAARLPADLESATRPPLGAARDRGSAAALVRRLRARGPLRRGRRAEVRGWVRARGGRRSDLRLPPRPRRVHGARDRGLHAGARTRARRLRPRLGAARAGAGAGHRGVAGVAPPDLPAALRGRAGGGRPSSPAGVGGPARRRARGTRDRVGLAPHARAL